MLHQELVIWTQRTRADLKAIHDYSERKAQCEIAGRGEFGKLRALTHTHADLQQVCRTGKEICDDTLG